MKLHMIPAVALATFLVAFATSAEAAGHKNLKVIKDNGKILKKGMKNLTKGLGVRCKACHVKGKWASDEVAAKEKTRAFLRATVGVSDVAQKEQALDELLKVLKIDKAKNATRVWKGVSMFEKK